MLKRLILIPFVIVLGLACTSKDEEPVHAVRIMKYTDLGSEGNRDQTKIESTRPRMVIKKGSLSLRVSDYQIAFEQVKAIVGQEKGFIVSTEVNQAENSARAATIIIKVPSDRFDTTINKLKMIADHIENETIRGNDVTEEYYDLTARLLNKHKVEQRFQEILKTAKNTKDILDVEKALGDVREEIEQMEGRKRYLSDQVDLSTLNLNIHETHYDISLSEGTFLSKISQGFRKGLNGVGDVLGFLINIGIAAIPIWIGLALLVFISIKLIKRYKSKTK